MWRVDERFRVEVLLREYDTLRTEILQRVRTRFELLAFLGVVAGLVAEGDSTARLSWLAPIALSLAAGVWLWLRQGILRCAGRIAAIETEVNERVGGGTLLVWETSQTRRRRLA